MNQLTSKQRKLVYLVGMVALLIPIIRLGMPSRGAEDPGGTLAQLRTRYELGEVSLGKVDPTSSTMNLVLLGLRGIATDLLWLQALEQQETKNWGQLRATVDSIIMLQPHYMKVWRHQGWNLAFNVSTEWDAVEDRWFWVKEGGKFLQEGSRRNRRYPELYWDVGHQILSQKIGRSDEWEFFRKFYREDPDVEQFGGKGDPALTTVNDNEFDDNYLAAREWFLIANERDKTHPQHIMMDMLFRQSPVRARFDYADTLQREGLFDEKTIDGWRVAFEEWTNIFGKEFFKTPGGWVFLEATSDADIEQMLAYNREHEIETDPPTLLRWIDHYRKTANYNYWRERALAERNPLTGAAHREIYEGQRLFKEGQVVPNRYRIAAGKCADIDALDLPERHRTVVEALCSAGKPLSRDELRAAASVDDQELSQVLRPLIEVRHLVDPVSQAQVVLEGGMDKLAQVFQDHPSFEFEDNLVEEALEAVLYWKYLHQLNELSPPEDFPLKRVWQLNQHRLPEIERRFKRENSLQ